MKAILKKYYDNSEHVGTYWIFPKNVVIINKEFLISDM